MFTLLKVIDNIGSKTRKNLRPTLTRLDLENIPSFSHNMWVFVFGFSCIGKTLFLLYLYTILSTPEVWTFPPYQAIP